MSLHNVFHYLGMQDVADLVARVADGDAGDLRTRADVTATSGDTLDRTATTIGSVADQLFASWTGGAADVAKQALHRAAEERTQQGQQLHRSSQAFSTVADALEKVQSVGRACLAESETMGRTLERILADAADVANAAAPVLGLVNSVVDSVTGVDVAGAVQQFLTANLTPLSDKASGVLATMEQAIADYEAVLREQGEVLRTMPGVVRKDAGPVDLPGDADLRRGALFRSVYGRDPVSDADRLMGQALDAQGSDAGNRVPNANVTVVRIAPVPGAGVVHGAAFIGDPIALNPVTPGDPFNFGDARGFDPSAGPDRARISYDIDYETGVVVVRQNASRSLGGNAATGVPDVGVEQDPSGRTRLRIDGTDALAGDAASDVRGSVRADLLIDPHGGTSAASVSGQATLFPSWEAYQDRAGETGDPLLQQAPLLLPPEHLLGDGPMTRLMLPTMPVGPDPGALDAWRAQYHPGQEDQPMDHGFTLPTAFGDDFYHYPVPNQPYPSVDSFGRLVVPSADRVG